MSRLILGFALAAVAAAAAGRYVLPSRRQSAKLAGLTKEELYKQAQVADIPGRSEMTKDELVRALARS